VASTGISVLVRGPRNDEAIFITELFVRKNVVDAGRHFQFSKTMLIYYEFSNSCAKINNRHARTYLIVCLYIIYNDNTITTTNAKNTTKKMSIELLHSILFRGQNSVRKLNDLCILYPVIDNLGEGIIY